MRGWGMRGWKWWCYWECVFLQTWWWNGKEKGLRGQFTSAIEFLLLFHCVVCCYFHLQNNCDIPYSFKSVQWCQRITHYCSYGAFCVGVFIQSNQSQILVDVLKYCVYHFYTPMSLHRVKWIWYSMVFSNYRYWKGDSWPFS